MLEAIFSYAPGIIALFSIILFIGNVFRKIENMQQTVNRKQDAEIAYISGRLNELELSNKLAILEGRLIVLEKIITKT